MSYAIIETGGKQLRVEAGRFYDIELLHVEPEAQVTIDKVLLVQHNDDVTIGQPFIEGATVEGTVLRHRRGKKVIVYKMRPKKKTRKKRGHRQEITQLLINSITLNGSVIAFEQTAIGGAQAADTTPDETPATQTVEAQTVEVAPVAEEPATVEAVAEETTFTATQETQATDTTPVADEPDAQTVEPDAAQEAVENVVAEDPDAETVTSEPSTESESQ